MNHASFFTLLGFILMGIGFYGVMTRKNLIKIVLSFTIAQTGLNIVIIALGYVEEKTAPILHNEELLKNPADKIVDPLPQALVLTAIVIGIAVTALFLSYIIKMYGVKKSLSIEDYKELKW